MRLTFATLAALTLLSACDSQTTDTSATGQADSAGMTSDNGGPAPILAEDLIIDEQSPTMEFEWSVPPIVARYPDLLQVLKTNAEASREKLAETAREQAQFRTEQDLPPLPVTHEQEWSAAFRNAMLINLVANTHVYTGGAHGNSFYQSMIWDKEERRQLEPADLFINWPDARQALSKPYCATLDEMRAKRRGEMTAPAEFAECPALGEQPIALRGRRGGAPTGITVLLSPYVAGSYAEGAYEVPVDFDENLRQALKARYRGQP